MSVITRRPVSPLPEELTTERLVLRRFRESDIDEYHNVHEASWEGHLSPWSPHRDLSKTRAEIRRDLRLYVNLAIEKWEHDEDYRFAITERGDGRIIGEVGITNIARSVIQAASLGYWIAKENCRKGFATEATARAIDFSFRCLRLHRITLSIAPDNPVSIKVAERLGLRFEGIAVRALFLGGHWQDTCIYAQTEEEWLEGSVHAPVNGLSSDR